MAENQTIPGRWDIHYEYATGVVAARFFDALKDDEEILGAPCPSCKRVLVPARSFCERCFVETEGLVSVGPEGVITSFTCPRDPVDARGDQFNLVALIMLDGADSAIPHFIQGVDTEDPKALFAAVRDGLRVRANFRAAADRVGGILDIRSFEPLE